MSEFDKTFGKRVRELRESVDMTQEHLAKKLRINRPAITQMERGERRICTEEMVRIAAIFNISPDILLSPGKEPTVFLAKDAPPEEKLPGIRINVPRKNLEKFREILLYVLGECGSKPNIGETVLYKLLYFIDFDYYEKYEEQIIGASYLKNHHGPTPMEFKKIVERMIENKEMEKVKSEYFNYPQTKYLPLRRPDLSKLTAREVETMDEVIRRLSDMNASQISDYSHHDVPWLTTENNKIIEYESVFYRTPPYSRREYDETVP